MSPLRRPLVLALVLAVCVLTVLPAQAEEGPAIDRPGYWLLKAEGLSKQIQHSEGRAAQLVSIGTGWVEAGDLVRARPLLAEAVEYGRKCRGCISKARRLAEIALLQHRAGDEAGAKATFRYAREACGELDGGRQLQAQAYLAQQLQAAGDAEQARSLFAKATKAAGMLKGFERAEALAAIADAEATAGEFKQAEHVRELLAKAVAQIGEDAKAILAGSRLTAAMAEVEDGRFDAAATLLETVDVPDLAVSGWLSLAMAAHDAGDADRVTKSLGLAWRHFEEIEEPEECSWYASEVARASRAVGHQLLERAAIVALEEQPPKIKPAVARYAAVVTLLDALNAAGRERELAEGLAALEGMEDSLAKDAETRDRMYGVRAGLLARVGASARALGAVRSIEDPVRRERVRLDVAAEMLKAERAPVPVLTAQFVVKVLLRWDADREERDELLRQAAVLLAVSGRFDEAEEAVDAIKAPFHAATACTYIARDLE